MSERDQTAAALSGLGLAIPPLLSLSRRRRRRRQSALPPAHVAVGPAWPERTYRWADLVAAKPDAVLVDAFPADGGLPAGAVMPAIVLVSGDRSNTQRSSKRISSLSVNGAAIL